ncbi:hypothetical protein NM208_g4189 [Fusarium decemcellulare]|uniref:Uncharacterized protein n=2 Tax=Fusarium decemcellulare TaxID=57161 RepID=A0ACC1SLH4_9HYPO|nr:hypothetical protein NM208_g4189 [Fusarium decemcellulare]
MSRPPESYTEICFCKIKLFRDHGAERKLSNDITHVEKSIGKLEQRPAQAESGLRHFGKRKHLIDTTKVGNAQRRSMTQDHKRTRPMRSVGSANEGNGARTSFEEGLHSQLQDLQTMFISTRPVSVLYLRGEELDDPDLHPVLLSDDAYPTTRSEDFRTPKWEARSMPHSVGGFIKLPSTSSVSLTPQSSESGSDGQWQGFNSLGADDAYLKGSKAPTRIRKMENEDVSSGWIEVLDVDPLYEPPEERDPKPVACFYVLCKSQVISGKLMYHRAIYVLERTLEELEARIVAKWGLDPSKILRTVYSIHGGSEVEMDDEIVRELRNGQDMTLEIDEVIRQTMGVNREREMAADLIDDAPKPAMSRPPSGFVLRLKF